MPDDKMATLGAKIAELGTKAAILNLCNQIDVENPDLVMVTDSSYRDPLDSGIDAQPKPWDRDAEETEAIRNSIQGVVNRFRALAAEL